MGSQAARRAESALKAHRLPAPSTRYYYLCDYVYYYILLLWLLWLQGPLGLLGLLSVLRGIVAIRAIRVESVERGAATLFSSGSK